MEAQEMGQNKLKAEENMWIIHGFFQHSLLFHCLITDSYLEWQTKPELLFLYNYPAGDV